MMSDSEIADRYPQRDDESEYEWNKRLRLLKANMIVQEAIDSGSLVDLGNGRVIERKHIH